MFEAMAGLIMATKIHFEQMKYPILKKQDRIIAETIYQNEVNKLEELERYEKSLLPESGYMTVEEYESKSRAKTKKQMAEDIDMNYNTLLAKMSGKSKFTLDEAVIIKTYLQEELPIEELFKND